MFGRRERKRPLSREQLSRLEDLRDDCIALFINSGMTQKEVEAAGGPTAATISKWLYKETLFPRYQTIEAFLLALGFGLTPMRVELIEEMRKHTRRSRLGIEVSFVGPPRMPPKKRRR